MSFIKSNGNCFCERCGHSWTSKNFGTDKNPSYLEPKSCAGCKSKVWNQPRVYVSQIGSKVIYPMAVRFKPTGRAAKKKI